ncbi:hypothetical protein Q7P37_011064 [Cladosporium fusiforme]
MEPKLPYMPVHSYEEQALNYHLSLRQKEKASMSSLPAELKTMILHLLSDTTDLHHAQLVNKAFYDIATPLLYENFELILNSEMADQFVNVLSNRSKGHESIQTLKVFLNVDHNSGPERAFQWLDMALDQIPQNRLTRFESAFHRPIPPHTQKKLWKSQQNKLENIELLPSRSLDGLYQPNVEDSITSLGGLLENIPFPNLKAVRVIPDGPQTASLCSFALEKGAPEAVTSLEVDARHWHDSAEFQHRFLMNTKKDQLVESLFQDFPRVGFGQKGRLDHLTTLKLKDVDLLESKYTWYTYLSLEHLTHLEIHYCKGADVFLTNLTKGENDPSLTTLHVVHDLGETPDRTIEAIDHVLEDISPGMVDLQLCLNRVWQLPKVESIAKHGESLRKLLLDYRVRSQSAGPCYSQDDLEKLLQPCACLEELAIPFPKIHLDFKILSAAAPKFEQYVQIIAKYCKVKVLSITGLPSDYENAQSKGVGYIESKNRKLEQLATDVFDLTYSIDSRDSISRIQPLEVLAFGTREREACALAPRFYVPCTFTYLNRTVPGSTQVYLSDLRQNGLSASILEYERRDWDEGSRTFFYEKDDEDEDHDANDWEGGW